MAKRLRPRWATTLAVLWLLPAALWAEPRPGRPVERLRIELQIAKLKARLALSPVTGEGGWRESQRILASAQLELARKLLARSNLRAAEVVAGQAERALARAEKKEEAK